MRGYYLLVTNHMQVLIVLVIRLSNNLPSVVRSLPHSSTTNPTFSQPTNTEHHSNNRITSQYEHEVSSLNPSIVPTRAPRGLYYYSQSQVFGDITMAKFSANQLWHHLRSWHWFARNEVEPELLGNLVMLGSTSQTVICEQSDATVSILQQRIIWPFCICQIFTVYLSIMCVQSIGRLPS